jgi:hypothetical protein
VFGFKSRSDQGKIQYEFQNAAIRKNIKTPRYFIYIEYKKREVEQSQSNRKNEKKNFLFLK